MDSTRSCAHGWLGDAGNWAGCLTFGQLVPVVTSHGLLWSVTQLQGGKQNTSTIAMNQLVR